MSCFLARHALSLQQKNVCYDSHDHTNKFHRNMKRAFILTLVSLLYAISMQAQTGRWHGKLNVQGMSLTIVFNISDEGCTMDSPDQNVKGIKAEKSVTDDGLLSISIPVIGASFEGKYCADSIPGTFRQRGIALPLTLKPGTQKVNRPQTPVPPFPYTTEEVSFTNGNATLRGTLTLPANFSRHTPAVIMVTGSGLQNRDEEIFEHKPFAVIADAFARTGIATLRYDDRGFGESTGDIVSFTTEDLKDDAGAGLTLLKERFDNAGVLGHSEGGSIALMLAAEGKADFVISLAGAVIPCRETLVSQNAHLLREKGFAEDVTDEYVAAISDAFDCIAKGQTPRDIDTSSLPFALKQNYKAAVRQCGTPYMRHLLALDIRKMLCNVRCPVLALNGSRDMQVDATRNLKALHDGMDSQLLTTVEVENVNHLFQHCNTGSISEYKDIEETFAPEVLQLMTDWLHKTASK